MPRTTPVLSAEVEARLKALGAVDILVGIPSFNNARTIGHVVRAVAAGLARHFPGQKTLLVNSDGGSTDGTREIVERTELGELAEVLVDAVPESPLARIVTPYSGLPGKGSALRTIFRIAADLDVRACCVVDSDLRSISPEWVELLLTPVHRHGYDFVAPLYARHRYDGTITNTIVYPLTRALYGFRVRQPIGGDFGFSGDLARRFLAWEDWEGPVARYGIDIFMTTTALAEGRRVCQSFLGAKLHDPKDPGADLQDMFVQVVSTLFGLMESFQAAWRTVAASRRTRVFGLPYAVGLEPVPVRVERLVEIFRKGAAELPPIWESFLDRPLVDAVRAAASGDAPRLDDETFVRVVYGAAAGYAGRRLPGETLLRSLVPVYLGKVATFVEETRSASADEAEERLESLALTYEREKPLLLSLWDSVEMPKTASKGGP
ncbi:MAG TPA: glycosyltransferase [Thermoanaerobaculia bacterium]|nr:glycosyltransferase [Thermoanaerobaculia bacterium]